MDTTIWICKDSIWDLCSTISRH